MTLERFPDPYLRQDGSFDRCHYVSVARAYRHREIRAFFSGLVFGKRGSVDHNLVDEG